MDGFLIDDIDFFKYSFFFSFSYVSRHQRLLITLICDIVTRLFFRKDLFTENKGENQLFPISKADSYAFGILW